jgi:hypothetical protein
VGSICLPLVSWYEVIGGRGAAEILRQVIEEYIPEESEQPPEE